MFRRQHAVSAVFGERFDNRGKQSDEKYRRPQNEREKKSLHLPCLIYFSFVCVLVDALLSSTELILPSSSLVLFHFAYFIFYHHPHSVLFLSLMTCPDLKRTEMLLPWAESSWAYFYSTRSRSLTIAKLCPLIYPTSILIKTQTIRSTVRANIPECHQATKSRPKNIFCRGTPRGILHGPPKTHQKGTRKA